MEKPGCTLDEKKNLIDFASKYLNEDISLDDIVWTYSGVRPLYNDGASSATAASRECVLKINETGGAPILNVFGGKITTYRRLAEHALEKIAPFFPKSGSSWTAGVALPGCDFAVDGVNALPTKLEIQYPFLSPRWAARLIKGYGTDAFLLLGDAKSAK